MFDDMMLLFSSLVTQKWSSLDETHSKRLFFPIIDNNNNNNNNNNNGNFMAKVLGKVPLRLKQATVRLGVLSCGWEKSTKIVRLVAES